MSKLPPVAGVDVAKNFSEIQIIDSYNEPYGKVIHPAIGGTHKAMIEALHKVQKAEKELGAKPVIVMEATGHYFKIIFYLFYNAGFDVVLINPLQTKSFSNAPNIRRATTDKISAKDIALLYRIGKLLPAKVPSETRIKIRSMTRDYWDFIDQASDWKRKFISVQDQIFLLYQRAFGKMFGTTALSIFLEYPTPERILKEKVEVIAEKVRKLARKPYSWAMQKVVLLQELATESPSVSEDIEMNIRKLQSYARAISVLSEEAKRLKSEIKELIQVDEDYKLLLTIPGIGPITGATIIGELGEFSWFKSAKEIVAFAGIDPKIFKSGKFEAVRVHMSKRGSPYLRRALFMAASTAAIAKSNGMAPNPVLGAYYCSLIKRGKHHKVAIGACMRKMIEYIFATLRDKKRFEVEGRHKKDEVGERKVKNAAFPVYDEKGRVISYAQEPVHVGTIVGSVMQNIQQRAKLI